MITRNLDLKQTGEQGNSNSDEVFEDAKEETKEDAEDDPENQKRQCDENQNRRHSKSVDEFELAHLRKQKQMQKQAEGEVAATDGRRTVKPTQMSLDIVDHREQAGKNPARQLSMPNAGCSIRRPSKDDSEVGKVDASILRKKFARLLDTLRSHKFSISSLEEDNSSSLKPAT